ncbi:hypothetical protein [Streptomyces sp. NPDC093261]|uniref:hypothetical protein n=1 Tax=Streptomyces sp. NPDC093261 TaxID=3366037 RepID=UPI0038211F69
MAAILEEAAEQAEHYANGGAMLADRMPGLVKGFGYAKPKGVAPLDDGDDRVFRMAMDAEVALRKAVQSGYANPEGVKKSMNPAFAAQFGAFMMSNPQVRGLEQALSGIQQALSELGKNITLTSPLNSGFVPFDLVSPSRLIYPVYSPLRNKLPRVAGQGTSRRAKVVTAVSGSGQSAAPVIDTTISEFVGSSNPSQLSNWPINLPGSGSQVGVDINVPYRFWGLTESLSWLSQFAGQGFEDISALANLVLLQEMMLSEEYADIAATSIPLNAPNAPTAVARAAGTGETAISGATSNIYVKVTYTNYYGETVASSALTVSWASPPSNPVLDIALPGLAGGMQANIYVTTGASPGTYYRAATGVGGSMYTLMGALPTSGSQPPATDTTTSAATRQEGILSTLSGHASNGSIYPAGAGWQAGYLNQTVNDTLNRNVLNTALAALWSSYKASPSEIVAEGSDVMRLSNDILNSNSNSNYRLYVEQGDSSGIRDGAAVSEFQNPITRDILKILVHPWLTQGTAMLMSYALPFAWSNVSNVWEKTMVQDYLSISWPVIDASFRYSLFQYGSLVCYAPQYNGLLQGLQVNNHAAGGGWA